VGAICILENPQSSGSVVLQSSNAQDAPVINPRFLTHPFDRRVMIEGMRETLKLLQAPVFAAKTLKVVGPEDNSDEAIWNHVKQFFGSSWHMCCTVRMGNSPESACVNSDFEIFGVSRLRVVDLSVCPFVPK
jgi:choline dehydrogenase-like flavoprotein